MISNVNGKEVTQSETRRFNHGWLLVALLLSFAFSSQQGHATSIKTFTVVEKTRAAPIILTGEIQERRAESILVVAVNLIKGSLLSDQIEILLAYHTKEVGTSRPTDFMLGEEVLFFITPVAGKYEPFAGDQGLLRLQPGWAPEYEEDIRRILAFDSTAPGPAKTSILKEMLQSTNHLVQLSALEIIYLEYHLQNFPTQPLIEPVTQLAKGRDITSVTFAVQVLSRIADKSAIPILIELLGSPQKTVAETAFRVTKRMTRAEFDFRWDISPEIRMRIVQDWRDWWDQYKDELVLVK